MRQKVLAGNWKMYKTHSEARAFLDQFVALIAGRDQERIVILCPPFTALETLCAAAGQHFAVGAQNLHWETQGAYTGEISAPMLLEMGIRYAIIGHSERRQYFSETDESVNKRLRSAQHQGITPILCVGEGLTEREDNETDAWICRQLDHGLEDANLEALIIAYEPIWAIGTGKTCESAEANRVIGMIRKYLGASNTSILYGGSVKPGNIDELMAQPEIDGVLVGGASLEAEGFARIVNYK
jgi:triosephosphate isomerase (TIM)